MSLVQALTCDCNPGFNWKSKATFSTHKKSQRHLNYEKKRREEKIQATRMSNERDLIQRMYENVVKEKLFLKEENKNLREEIENLKNQLELKQRCLSKSSSGVCFQVNRPNSFEGSNDSVPSTPKYLS